MARYTFLVHRPAEIVALQAFRSHFILGFFAQKRKHQPWADFWTNLHIEVLQEELRDGFGPHVDGGFAYLPQTDFHALFKENGKEFKNMFYRRVMEQAQLIGDPVGWDEVTEMIHRFSRYLTGDCYRNEFGEIIRLKTRPGKQSTEERMQNPTRKGMDCVDVESRWVKVNPQRIEQDYLKIAA